MRLTKYLTKFLLYLCCSCESSQDNIFPDRTVINSPFFLDTVKNIEGRTIESYEYSQDTLRQVLLKGYDHYRLSYREGKLSHFNNYQCSYNNQGQLSGIQGPGFVQAQINYRPGTIEIIQQTATIVPTKVPMAVDTLTLLLDVTGKVQFATLMPANKAYSYTFDDNISPYFAINKTLIPLLLMYPLAEISPQLVSLLQGNNLLRYTLQSAQGRAGVEQLTRLDYTYRFNHPQFDIPTSMTTNGEQTQVRYYHYSTSNSPEHN